MKTKKPTYDDIEFAAYFYPRISRLFTQMANRKVGYLNRRGEGCVFEAQGALAKAKLALVYHKDYQIVCTAKGVEIIETKALKK